MMYKRFYVQYAVIFIPGSPLGQYPAAEPVIIDDHNVSVGKAGCYLLPVEEMDAPDAFGSEVRKCRDRIKAKVG